MQVPMTLSLLSTTQVEQSSGQNRLGHQVKIIIIEEALF